MFVVVLGVSVFLLALHTRVCLFNTYRLCIKAFADDYDRLKVKAVVNRSTHSVVSARTASHSIAFFSPRTLPDLKLGTAATGEDAAPRLICFAGLPKAIRPPPLE
jgi:hypothetical protein